MHVAQSVERRSRNTEVAGSIPNRGWAIFLLTRYGLLSLTKNTL